MGIQISHRKIKNQQYKKKKKKKNPNRNNGTRSTVGRIRNCQHFLTPRHQANCLDSDESENAEKRHSKKRVGSTQACAFLPLGDKFFK
ncbi:hypothetical protein CEXT_630411 [Caerostris extrusa]|uniref:Uncharacterized protein n=1 Tax=Caerostris extrusa TaxID=172846 RepID=A0AAV4N8M7_CAEEX|nr:hypothetical protein CEXT_630411 [Caerostris extrusa]